jgi:hypothetical protein
VHPLSLLILLPPFPRAPPPPPRQLVFAVGANGPAFRRKCQKLSLSSFSVWVCKLRLCLGANAYRKLRSGWEHTGLNPMASSRSGWTHTDPSICQKEYQIGCQNRCRNRCQIERYTVIYGARLVPESPTKIFPLSGDVHVDPAMPPGKLPMDSKSLFAMRLSPLTVVF